MTIRILIDNSLETGAASYLFENPCGEIRADSSAEVSPAIEALSQAVGNGLHAAGFFSYELGYALEPRLRPLMPARRAAPLLHFGLFENRETLSAAEATVLLGSWSSGGYDLSAPALSMSRVQYRKRFARTQDYIAAGDIYQLNLTLKGRFLFTGCPAALYRDLRRKQPVAYGAFMDFGDTRLLSLSPELFLKIDGDSALTRPMKGTAPRGMTAADDADIRCWLTNDEKSRAENLMIVDLMRNDLGRIAETGSVRVNALFAVETYRTLHQMTSEVGAKLKDGTDLTALLKSLFPPGSITGAPKLRAMEIIRDMEDDARGVYTGAIGMLEPGGNARFNVGIRTLMIGADGKGELGIGSGVVHDSTADAEYDECLLKMRFLTEPVRDFELIETLLHDSRSGYALLERHLDRLVSSARYFAYPVDRETVSETLRGHAAKLPGGLHRIRLLLDREGGLKVASVAIPEPPRNHRMTYVFSPHRTRSDDGFLYHKTTERGLYDSEHARLSAELGADEVLFINERGELTEGSRTNVFLRRGAALLTPALRSGLLPGTLRADLIERGEAVEATLYPDDLERADAVYLGNSVRGLVPALPLAVPARQAAGP